jgi:hypothetical protein
MPYCEIKGQLVLSEARINFAADEKNYKYLMVRILTKLIKAV